MRLSIVMPVYNEERTVDRVLDAVLASPVEAEIEVIVVDDASTDASAQRLAARAAAEPRIRLLRHERNRGKGAALRTGFAAATGDVVLVQDADLEYDPADYPRLVAPIADGSADVVIGSRFAPGADAADSAAARGRRAHYFGNRLLTWLSNRMTGLDLTDMEACYKVFRREAIQGLHLRSERFGIEPELVQKAARAGWRVAEVPIAYRRRSYREGKKITWRDGLAAVWHIVRFRFFD
ncbi:MAG TPA: glycosyltransferase family 2 protein [Phycisphaerae bacterium]|nr:glycosyltransferase family 2 protein [Phycisphaerae bacterium]HOI56405.1 glycosyltransferase family 2 protein [Phycisphaerae bacterium]